MKKTKLILQKNYTDCAICCLAMATKKSYKEILAEVNSYMNIHEPNEKFDGMYPEMENSILWKFNVNFSFYELKYEYKVVRGYIKKYAPKEIDFKTVVGNKRALLSCPSLNFEKKGHALYWDGKKLHDPSNLKKYTAKRAFKSAYAAVVLK